MQQLLNLCTEVLAITQTALQASDAKDGQSTVTLDIGGGSNATHMFKLVRSANDPENNDNTAVGSNQVVVIARASNLYN